jgi:hypothetical protein
VEQPSNVWGTRQVDQEELSLSLTNNVLVRYMWSCLVEEKQEKVDQTLVEQSSVVWGTRQVDQEEPSLSITTTQQDKCGSALFKFTTKQFFQTLEEQISNAWGT